MFIEFEIADPKLISVNEQYMHPVRKCNDGRYRSYVCKTSQLKELQKYYEEKLQESIVGEAIDYFKSKVSKLNSIGIKLSMEIGFPRNQIYEHDISNFIKALEDCISQRLEIDDSYNYSVSIVKKRSLDDKWYLKVKIELMKLENYEEVNNYEVQD